MSVKFENITLVGGKVGIFADGPVSIDLKNVTFQNVEKPFDIRGAREVRAEGTRIERSQSNIGVSRTRIGYSGRNGPPLPAQCPKCQSIFPSVNYDIGSSVFYGFDNQEICQNPQCGFEGAKLANGLFDLAKETVVILQAEPLTHEMLAAVKAASEDFLSGRSNAANTVEKIEKASASLARKFAQALNLGGAAATLFALWFTIFPSHLEAVQNITGQADTAHRNYQVETICLNAFGQASRCRFVISPDQIDNKNNRAQGEGPPMPTDFFVKSDPEASSCGHNTLLPLHGPIPSKKPMNRHERRKALKMQSKK